MKDIATTIFIAAPTHVVWRALTEFDAYPKWNPFITAISGDLREEAKLAVEMKLEGGKPTRFSPRMLVVKEGEEFRWAGVLGSAVLFRGEHRFILRPHADGGTDLEHGESFSGVLVPLFGGVLKRTEAAFHAMNRALKERAEALE